jgi:hypothetical protein
VGSAAAASRRARSGRGADPGGCPAHPETVLRQPLEQGADFLLTVKANQKIIHRQFRRQFQGRRKILFFATDYEVSHGRIIAWTLRSKKALEHIQQAWVGSSWIVEVWATGSREGKLTRANQVDARFASPSCYSYLLTSGNTAVSSGSASA